MGAPLLRREGRQEGALAACSAAVRVPSALCYAMQGAVGERVQCCESVKVRMRPAAAVGAATRLGLIDSAVLDVPPAI